jgi:hypothetical protein
MTIFAGAAVGVGALHVISSALRGSVRNPEVAGETTSTPARQVQRAIPRQVPEPIAWPGGVRVRGQ